MTGPSAEEQLRAQVRAALKASGRKQVWIANKLGISPKHLSQMLTGRVSLTLDWAQQIAVLCDARVLVFVTAPPGTPDREHRIRLDDLNSDDLDRLYDDLDRYAEVVSEMNEALTQSARDLAALRQVARGYCPACGRGDAAPHVEDWEQQKQRADQADEAARLALEQRQQMAAERHTWQERGDRAEAALTRARDACDQLRRAAVLADGQPHTDRERGIVHAIDRIHTALDTPEPTP